MRGDAPSPSPSLDATLSVPADVGVSGTRVGVDGVERGAGIGEAGGGRGDLGADPGKAGSDMGLTLMPYFCSIDERHGQIYAVHNESGHTFLGSQWTYLLNNHPHLVVV